MDLALFAEWQIFGKSGAAGSENCWLFKYLVHSGF